ncbi:AbiTii domain-containing protein, partial [Microbacterium maritypicum]
MTLLDDVIEQASDGDASAMLRKLMIVAHRLGADSLLAWVKAELNGYDTKSSVPDYRGPFAVTVKAHITGPFGAQAPSTLTRAGTPDYFGGLFEVSFSEPLAVMEGYATSGDGIVYPWDPLAIGLYNGWIQDGRVPFVEGWGVFSAQRAVSPGTFQGIVDVVRTRALELALDLQADFPEAGEKHGPTVTDPAVQEAVTTITNIIYGSVTGLAQGHTVTQKVRVAAGDLG